MSARDRSVSLVLVVTAAIAWIVAAVVFTTLSPVGDAGVQLLGALTLGAAVGVMAWLLLWSASSHGEQGDGPSRIATAGRRGGLMGLVVTILVVLQALDAVALPVLLFLVITAVLVEVAFTLRH